MKRFTNSELACWSECKRKWWLSTYRGLQRRGRSDFNKPLGIGSRVHDALEVHYAGGDAIMELLTSVGRDLGEFPAYEDDIKKEADLAEKMVKGYLDWLEEEGADADLKVIASEEAREVPLFEGATLLAKLDARVERDGKRMSLEHKTGPAGVELEVLQINTQMLTQHLVEYLTLLEEGKEGDVSDGVIVNFLKKSKRTDRAKGPFYWREDVRHNKDQLRSHWHHVVARAREILRTEEELRAGADHHDVCYPSPTGTCSWKCQFVHVCSMFDTGADVEGALEDQYETHDPLERYFEE